MTPTVLRIIIAFCLTSVIAFIYGIAKAVKHYRKKPDFWKNLFSHRF